MLKYRFANINDAPLYFQWVNDASVRMNSINNDVIDYSTHLKWFTEKVNDSRVFLYIFLFNDTPAGQVRIEIRDNYSFVGQSVDKYFRGKGLSTEMLQMGTDDFLLKHPNETIISIVKKTNVASIKMAANSGFNILDNNTENDSILVLKGKNQVNQDYVQFALNFYNLK